MVSQNASRIKLLKIWEILCQETDEDHPIDSNVLIERLEDMGIPCNRKTLYNDIQVLCDCGYEVMCERRRYNQYYVIDRSFDLPELHILLDAVQAASFITPKKTKEFVDKLAALAGSRSGEVMKRNIVAFNTTKNTNEVIYYTINEIVCAINKKKKIEFTYFDYDPKHKKVYRKDGAKYTMNPYATVFSNDNYYLLCYNDKHKTIMHFRVDRIDNIKMLDEEISPLPEEQSFDVKKHKKEVFGMFTGQEEKVSFIVEKSLLDVIFDRFGSNVKLYEQDENHYTFTAEVQVSPVFIGWCCAFGKKLKVLGPENVKEQIKQRLVETIELY